MASKLGAALGTNAKFWLNAQRAVNLFSVRKSTKVLPCRIRKTMLGWQCEVGQALRASQQSFAQRSTWGHISRRIADPDHHSPININPLPACSIDLGMHRIQCLPEPG